MLFMDFLTLEWRNLARIQIESRCKTVRLVRIGHIEIPSFPERLYKCNFLAFMFTHRSVGYIPGRYVSSHNHTTMDNQRMSWNVLSWVWSKARHQSDPFVFEGKCVFYACLCVCVPRLPLLPMLGSLASAIQLYSGGMETGLRSPGRTNQLSESLLWGEGVGVSRLRDSLGDSWRGGQERQGVCRWGGGTGEYDVQGKGHMALCSGFSVKRVCDSGSKLQNHRRPTFNTVNASSTDDALKLLLC